MESTLAFVVGALIASTKGLALVALGFGIAWWRTRSRLRRLESEGSRPPLELEPRLDRLESSLDSMHGALDRLAAGQEQLRRAMLPAPPVRGLERADDREPPRVSTPV